MINSVTKALNILTELSNAEDKPITIKTISEKLDINRSTCSHIVKTLEENGFAERVSHHDGYVLGPEAYYLSRFGKYAEQTISICQPVMKWLYKKSGCPVILATIKNEKKFIIESLDDEHTLFNKKLNIRYDDIYRTATGRVLLSRLNRCEIEAVYKKYLLPDKNIWPEVTSYEKLLSELEKISKMDVVSSSQFLHDIDAFSIGYGCPIFKKKDCLGALGVAVSVSREKYNDFNEEEKRITKLLKTAANEINRRINYV